MIKRITTNNFKDYGWLIDYPRLLSAPKKCNLFRIVLKETGKFGWRIAYLVVRDKIIDRLEQHPASLESFEPVKGKSLLFVASAKNKNNIECFLLEKPVVLKKGIWHGVVTLSPQTEIKITENARVQCIYWKPGFCLSKNSKKPSSD